MINILKSSIFAKIIEIGFYIASIFYCYDWKLPLIVNEKARLIIENGI